MSVLETGHRTTRSTLPHCPARTQDGREASVWVSSIPQHASPRRRVYQIQGLLSPGTQTFLKCCEWSSNPGSRLRRTIFAPQGLAALHIRHARLARHRASLHHFAAYRVHLRRSQTAVEWAAETIEAAEVSPWAQIL